MSSNISGNRPANTDADNSRAHSTASDFSLYCLKILGIGLQTEVGKRITVAVKRLPANTQHGEEWLVVMKTIAEICAKKDGYIFTQSQLYDFLVLAIRQLGEKASKRFRLSDLVFKIYKDVMEHYMRSDHVLRSQYPIIIVDTLSVLLHGTDFKGKQVSTHGLEKYFEERKAQSHLGYHRPDLPRNIAKGDEDLVDRLSLITGRERSILIPLVKKLDSIDIDKLRDLCVNYDKLQKYIALMGSEGEFRKELENELGRKLTNNQLQHARVSVRKSRSYIENVLDGKFLRHGSHGINHVRHNLEYGYQIIGIIERKRRGSPRTS